MSREGHVEIDPPAAGEAAGRDAAGYLAEAHARWFLRRNLAREFSPDHALVARCERALHACIQAAAAADPPAQPAGGMEADVFTWLAAHLAGDAVPAAARDRAAQQGLEPPAADAIVLFPCPAAEAWLRELFQQVPASRGAVMEVWREQGRPPGTAPLPADRLLDEHPEAVLAWHAGHPDGDGDLLARHYRAPAAGAHTPGLAAAIEGGLLRGDPAASAALEAALHEAGPGAPPPLLDLAALAGLEHALPVLHRAALDQGGETWLRLAWLGTPAVLEPLVEAMGDARHAGDAARAWGLVTGHRPGAVPRLREVGGGTGPDRADDGTLPDAADAGRWLDEHRQELSPGTRYLLGRPAVPALLAGLARRRAGRLGTVLARRLRLAVARPVPLPARGWRRAAVAAVSELAEGDGP